MNVPRMVETRNHSSYSDPSVYTTDKLEIDWKINFNAQTISGSVNIFLKKVCPDSLNPNIVCLF
ncbi:uncharacterized protein DC041_0001950 [Schistosoma bovis]|uniref:Uncharacterized protein n=1 Tax=Schistosoma bovis TaxID=6184 RepID=A0A430QEH7_SCHBO|nr:uncharacterized protein DC041_0001950 [Schistosoma bovis]